MTTSEARPQEQIAKKEDFNKTHPELQEGEVFLTNAAPIDWDKIVYESKRKGDIAYMINGTPLKEGNPVSWHFPVFVKRDELAGLGLDPDAPYPHQ